MNQISRRALPLLVLPWGWGLLGCDGEDLGPPLFRLLTPDRTGITFANTITPTETHTFDRHFFLYNGAGVAVGDIDGDGLPDIYFTGNMVSSRLYLNRGDMRFEDITESAGVMTDRWATGATMVDIDGDGDLDIYVSVAGPEWTPPEERANLLFINNGDRTFTEAAASFGIDDTGYTTHAVFFDYDGDGTLDLFLLGNSPGEFGRGETGRPSFGARAADPAGFDQLYRNNGNGTFTRVSEEAGIQRELGYGLGVVATDVNGDGWPDIYVSNDITPNDVLYINNGDGTFTDRAGEWLGHTSFAGMGIDIADFNNDGWPDILQMDMMPQDLAGRKRISGSTTYIKLRRLSSRGFAPQYNTNTLQLNRGVTADGRVIFSEIARMAGVAYTDWSWSALFGDYDNDGFKDIFVTNGYPKAVIDFDYQTERFSARRITDEGRSQARIRELLDELHGYHVPNYVFRNEADLTFSDRTREWGLSHPGFSYGAAHADLNNDGRLDLVVNNLDAPAFIYANVGPADGRNHSLQIRLEGEGPNTGGLGSRVILTAGGQRQYIDHTPYRGYMSTMDDRIHFGLGQADRVDTLEVIWPDGRYQALTDIPGDQLLTIDQRRATGKSAARLSARLTAAREKRRIFQPVDAGSGLAYEHRSNDYRVDYTVQPLLPYQVSREGPPIAVADVTGNGLDDVFIGGAAGFPGTLLLQQEDGRFVESAGPWTDDVDHEDWGALFFDANGDGRPDLYVASGGYHLPPESLRLQDRLYLNQGGGRFVKDSTALPEMTTSTAAVEAGDFNGDGRLDLFVGGRLTPGNYPHPARSYILRNDGGRFTDVTRELAPELVEPGGMVTDAVWLDFTGDGRLDLVTAGIWMPIRFYANEGSRFRDVTGATGLPPMRGWWYSLEKGDVDGDGLTDLVAGNLGLNHSYTTSEESRFGVRAADVDGNRTTDIILTREIDGTEYPLHGLLPLGGAIEALNARFPTFESFAGASVREIFGPMRDAIHYQADTFASVWLRNGGEGTFTSLELPAMAQISPIRGILVHDVDGDGNLDLVVAGNTYETEPNTARADAGKGLWL
ncbi:MAG TPA: VCBS repeat-containing protein, partial [Longimicrobiales bacterium]|nr:VCBS repeat-containing protein [Longimicrobiales bacterium]